MKISFTADEKNLERPIFPSKNFFTKFKIIKLLKFTFLFQNSYSRVVNFPISVQSN